MLGGVGHVLCRAGLHKWSENTGGVRVCMRPGCTATDMYFGITGALRRLRERYTQEEIEEMAKPEPEFPIFNRIISFMALFAVAGLIAAGVWKYIVQVYGNIENPAGAVIRFGLTGWFMILIWFGLSRKKKRRSDEV